MVIGGPAGGPPEMTVKLADFGIARAAEQTRLTQVGSVVGTAAYLSPEQSRGEEATPGSDVYSLGVVVYQMLTARLPYEGNSLAELAIRRENERPLPADELRAEDPGGAVGGRAQGRSRTSRRTATSTRSPSRAALRAGLCRDRARRRGDDPNWSPARSNGGDPGRPAGAADPDLAARAPPGRGGRPPPPRRPRRPPSAPSPRPQALGGSACSRRARRDRPDRDRRRARRRGDPARHRRRPATPTSVSTSSTRSISRSSGIKEFIQDNTQ